MRLLYLISDMAGGGAQRQLAFLVAAQVHAGHDVHVGLFSGGADLSRLEKSHPGIHWIRSHGNYDPTILFRLTRLVRELQPDLMQTWLTQMDVLGGAAAQVCGLPWILTERSSAPAYPSSVKNWLRRRIAVYADAIVSNSAAGDSYWKALLGERTQRYIIPNAVPFEEIACASSTDVLGTVAHRPIVLFGGRLVQDKNLPVLLEALRQVVNRCDAMALLCGEGPERPALETKVRQNHFGGRVALAGYRHDLWALMKESAVFVSVSLFEGQPNTVLEAMACGCPLVVSDIPSHREFLDERSAWMVSPHKPGEIADAICQAISTPAEAQRRAAWARVKVEKYSLSAAARRFEEVYREVLLRANARRQGGK